MFFSIHMYKKLGMNCRIKCNWKIKQKLKNIDYCKHNHNDAINYINTYTQY